MKGRSEVNIVSVVTSQLEVGVSAALYKSSAAYEPEVRLKIISRPYLKCSNQ